MKKFERNTSPGLYTALVLTVLAIYVGDFFAPLGMGAYILYMVPVAMGFFTWRPLVPLVTALVTSVLIVADFLMTPEGDFSYMARLNRAFGVLTIWILAGLGYQFIRVKLEVRLQEWLQTAQAELSKRLAGDQKLEELGNHALGFLCEATGAQAGAVFLEDGGFRRFATYGAAGGSVPESFTTGDGLLGQAVRDARNFVIDDVPDGYLKAGSALGESAPRHLLIAVGMLHGKVNSVMEFGFFSPVTRAARELTAAVSESMGTAVRSAKYRARLQELLEETRQQSQELQAQSEELRVSNEELEEQGRALKESQAQMEMQQVELEQSNSQLEEQAQILEMQKDDLNRTKLKLEEQARVLEQASRYKSDFLANMSHELRTPLNSSLILAKLLADNREGNLTSEQIKFAQTIQTSGNDLLALINDVLDLAKVESGHLELRPEELATADLAGNLRRIFQPVAVQKGLALHVEVSPQFPKTFETDPQRLEQVLKNLLSNALKFTEKGSVVLEMAVRPDTGRLAFAVKDTGIGIPPEQQQIVFEPFCQADGTTNRKYGGTGLGLSISRELARLLGGEIELRSEPGQGSTFTIVIPPDLKSTEEAGGAATEAPAPVSASAMPSAAAARGKQSTGAETAVPVADDRERLSGDSRMVLIVEDDQAFADILQDLAHETGFQCVVAPTAAEALVLSRQYTPGAIILDVGLPDDSGLLVLERLKRDARTRHIPVHVISGGDFVQPALAMGAVGFMLKPVMREQLIRVFEGLETRLSQKLRRVLVVEDDPVQIESMKLLFASQDVETTGAATAAECLEKLRTTTFDCMVLDLSLPDASGFSLLETLSAEDKYSFPPVIVYTGRELSAEEEQRLRRYSKSIILKGAKSPERLLDEVTLFLHQVVSDMPREKQQMLEMSLRRDAMLDGRRILMAEDDVRNIFALSSFLEPLGLKLQIARNGREAIEALERSLETPGEAVDLVLMDIMMPEMDGLTAMQKIRERPEWKKLPIIALTAKAMKTDQEQCLKAGASDYLAKPLDVEKLLSLIRVWMPR